MLVLINSLSTTQCLKGILVMCTYKGRKLNTLTGNMAKLGTVNPQMK